MSEKKPKECEKCGFVDCKCDMIAEMTFKTPKPFVRENNKDFELDKLKEEFNKISKTENLEIKKLQEKVKSSKDDQEIIVLSKIIIELDPNTFAAYTDLTSALMRSNQMVEAEKWYRKLIALIDSEGPVASDNFKPIFIFRSYFGYILYRNKKYDEALDFFDEHLDSVKIDPFSWYWKCVILQKDQKYRDALHYCEKIIELNTIQEISKPFDYLVGVAWTEKADIQNSLGEYENALESIDKAISITDESLNATNVWIGKGTIYQNLGNHEDALQCFEKGLSLDNNNTLLMNYKSVELAELGRFDEAEKCCKDIISIDKFQSNSWGNLASIYLQKGNDVKSFECSSISLSIDPDNLVALQAHCVVLSSFKKYNEALDVIERILKIEKNSRMQVAKINMLLKLNLNAKALEYTDEVLSRNFFKDNELVPILSYKIKLFLNSQEHEKMLTVCNKVLSIDENDENALIGKCIALNGLRKFPECLDCCNELLRIDENSIDALNISSVILRELGKISESIENSKRMLAIDENVPTALYNLGFTLTEQKKYLEALKYINRFFEVKQTDPNAPIEDAKKLRDKLIEKIQSK